MASVDTADGGNLAPSGVLNLCNFQNLRRLRWCRSSSINSGVSKNLRSSKVGSPTADIPKADSLFRGIVFLK